MISMIDQHQHHVDQRRGVDVEHHFRFARSRCRSRRCSSAASSSTLGRRLGDEADLADRRALALRTARGRSPRSGSVRRRGSAPRAAASAPRSSSAARTARRCRAPGVRFQNTSPSLLTEMSMFSGRVCRGVLLSRGRFSAIVWVTTGIVIRKMISSTSITSTSGVVLMSETTSSSSPAAPEPDRHVRSRLAPQLQRLSARRRSARPSARRADRRRSCAPIPSSPCCGAPASCSRAPRAPRPPGRSPS